MIEKYGHTSFVHLDEVKKKISDKRKEEYANGKISIFSLTNPFKGKQHSEIWKKNHSELMKEKQKGNRNSQYGKFWITDGIENMKVQKIEDIPNGWYRGRKINRSNE